MMTVFCEIFSCDASLWILNSTCGSNRKRVQITSSLLLLSQDVKLVDLRGRSRHFCQDSSPASWLATWRYPRLLIGSFCQQITPRRRMMRSKSRQPDTTRPMMTSEEKKKKEDQESFLYSQSRVFRVWKVYLCLSLVKALDTLRPGPLKWTAL